MIQRIQTIYLIISLSLLSLLLFNPVAQFYESDGNLLYQYDQAIKTSVSNEVIIHTYPVFILLLLTICLSAITIFIYKNRRLQMRLCVFNIVLIIGIFGLIYFYYKAGITQVVSKMNLEIVSRKMTFYTLAPFFSAFFTYLAYKGIQKDEILIKSIDRIRK